MNVKIGFDDSVADTDWDILFNETENTITIHHVTYSIEAFQTLGAQENVGKTFRIVSNSDGVVVLEEVHGEKEEQK